MKVRTSSRTTITCYIELSEEEKFPFKRSRWTPTVWVSNLSIEWDHFKMFYRDKRGTLRSISRDRYPGNVHFSVGDVPNLPAEVRQIIEEKQITLHNEHQLANPPEDKLF